VRDLTARIYQVSRLEESKIEALQKREKWAGIAERPYEIKNRYNLPETGDVPEELFRDTEKKIHAIYEMIRGQYRAKHTGCCFKSSFGETPRNSDGCLPSCGPNNADIAMLHHFDRLVLADVSIGKIDVKFPQSGHGKAKKGMEGAA